MAIKQSADGYYRTTVRYCGKQYHITAKTEASAIRKAAKLKTELQHGVRNRNERTTVSEFATEWLRTYRASETENDKRYEQLVNNIIIPQIGDRQLSSITEMDLQMLLNGNSHYSKSQLSKLRMTLKQIFRKARKNHLIIDDPSEDLVLPACAAGTHRAITDDERERILQLAETDRAGLYIKIMLYCGLRDNEVDALQWRYVDMDKDVIHVRQAVKHGSGAIGPPKSKAGVRDVPIPSALHDALEKAYSGDADGYVCTNLTGERHTSASRNRMWRSFKRALDIAGGAEVYRNRIIKSTVAEDLTLYCLRHTYCTDLQRAGVPLNVAKVLMGHEDISVTANIYSHVNEADTQKAVESLEAYIEQKKQEEIRTSNVIRVNFRRQA